MRHSFTPWFCFVVILASSAAARAQATRPSAGTGADPDETKRRFAEMVRRTSSPTEQHKALQPLVGEFDETAEVHLGPGEPMRARAVVHGRWIMDGRFVEVDSESAPDETLKGQRMVVYGYDPAAHKYTLWQVESASLTAATATGDYDAPSRTFTFDGVRGDPNQPAFRWRIKLEDDGSITQTVEMKRPGAQEFSELVKVRRTPRRG